MAERTKQRIRIKFCFNIGKNCLDDIEMFMLMILKLNNNLRSASFHPKQNKINVYCFLDYKGKVHYKYVPTEQQWRWTMKFSKDCVMQETATETLGNLSIAYSSRQCLDQQYLLEHSVAVPKASIHSRYSFLWLLVVSSIVNAA